MIEARNVSVSIGRSRILSGVDFCARPGEVTAIVGPNGSGKSTLVKALSGDLPYAGTIAFNGRDLAAMRPSEAAVVRAVLPQATTLAFPYTVREVVRLGLMGGRSGALAGQEEMLPERALARVDLSGFAGRFYQELSGGEQQRVQLARALCQVWAPVLEGRPRYLILDEPVSSLDIKHQILVMQIARGFAARGGGVVAVLHDLNLTAAFADHVFVMRRGAVAAGGAPQAVMQDALLSAVFDCPLKVGAVPAASVPFVLPQAGLA
ncbi:heme ABC transporter ATP-binding protein [Chelativorans intermedius]|uniref:Heme ABC transporter ATP-binding protein n=1 Tax=Chelativorans intermedius TaxID=515947 RepID=A0ABV6D403_9HYPH|nr:heme ABC transporter ATP-binding protein [Chelativorans intermedius]MCT8997068.1 heme ABC transporter ATP-binding protein [Chelativorans intermedius]